MTNFQHDSPSARLSEFALIERYFKNKTISRQDVVLGIGDDAALLVVPPQELLVVTVDTLVAGVHFPAATNAFDIGYKALAVNLSDLAAMGATPLWFTLALTLPQADPVWLQAFTDGLFYLANDYQLQLIGGDTTRGPLSITIQVHGCVSEQHALRRSGAKPQDKIYVSGTLGDAGLGLQAATGEKCLTDEAEQFVLQRLNRPTPRIELGLILRDYASSAIDISDGLLADLQHICTASNVGAELTTASLPLSKVLRENLQHDDAIKMALTAGDDYELCFTVPPELEAGFVNKLKSARIECTCIGVITSDADILLMDYFRGLENTGYQHFNNLIK